MLRYLRPYGWLFAVGIVLATISTAFDAFSLILLIPFLRSLFGMGPLLPGGGRNLAERVIDRVAGQWLGGIEGLEALRVVCVLVLAAVVLKNLFFYGSKLVSIYVQEKVERDMRDDVYSHLQRLPLGFFDRSRVGQLITRVLNDTRETKHMVTTWLSDLLRSAITIVVYLATLFFLSWRLTLLSLLLVPLIAAALGPVVRKLRSRFHRAWQRQGELVSVLQETVSGIRLVKAYGGEAYENRRFRDESDRFSRGFIRATSIAHLASPLSEVLSSVAALALIWIGAGYVLDAGTLGPEQFLAFVTIAVRMVSPIKAVSQFPARVQQSLAASERFQEILDRPPEGEGGEAEGEEIDEFRDEIRFDGVSFAYEPETPVLRDVSLAVRKGEVVALVGPSGAGKTTLVDLLPRFIDPDQGRILIDGRDLRDLSLSSLRRLFGIVSQETVIFNDTVRANIAYARPDDWSDEEIEAAARAANAHPFIVELPEGYETRLGERGVRLSGGQRQRIGIARALLRDPPILIMDEATSSLDSESERLIQEAMARLRRGRTVFVIAHRLSTVQGAERIVVLERGRVNDSGSHAELHERDGLYRRLYELQFESPPVGAGTAG